MKRLGSVVLLVVIVLAGCSSSSKHGAANKAATSRATQTVAQVASLVAEHRPVLTEWLAKEHDGCQQLELKASQADAFKTIETTPEIEMTLAVSGCTGPMDQVRPEAVALAAALTAASPPAELRTLAAETAAAATAQVSGDDGLASCINTAGTDYGAVFDCGVSNGGDPTALQAKLAAWDAYL